MKIAPIIHAIDRAKQNGLGFEYRLVHTGQHYDERMSGNFFSQLKIPAPHVNLGVGSGSQAEQTAAIMVSYERLLLSEPSELCLVVGDVTSTMACAITAQKVGIPVAHVEGGIRSYDWTMPEEINRLVTDSITTYFFTTSQIANENLRQSGVSEGRIFFVGNTMIDSLLANQSHLRPMECWEALALSTAQYIVLTLHRPSNVDNLDLLSSLLDSVALCSRGLPVVFPVHPRTAKTLAKLTSIPINIHVIEPQPYLEFIHLIKHAKAVITDSGGITEETTVLDIPCMTLRTSTERPETVALGTNELLGTDPQALVPAFERLFAGDWKKGKIPEKWDGRAGERIVESLFSIMATL
jgi:UDP-N-acetylglucosamine 2-epimerase (non-hydrolysing)